MLLKDQVAEGNEKKKGNFTQKRRQKKSTPGSDAEESATNISYVEWTTAGRSSC